MIGNKAWLGFDSAILKGVRIGEEQWSAQKVW